MLRPCLLALTLLALPAFTTAPSGDDPYPRRVGIDIEHYRFEITLSDATDEITGRATVTALFTRDGVTELPLDLTSVGADGRGMMVRRVAVADADGGPAVRGGTGAGGATLRHTHADDLLTVALPSPSRAGDRLSVTIDYAGVPAAGLRIGPNKHGDRTFFSDNWPNRARNWLPTVDHIADKATSELVVTAPAHYQVISNGALVEETDLLDGTRLTHWRQDVPISPWLYVLGAARFAVQQVGEFRGKPIQTWVYPQDRDAGFHDFAAPTRQALEFYEDHVGPFAYAKLANITSPATGGGMEAATALMYGENMVTGTRTDRVRNVVIHEVAHQWFGNAVTEESWDDVWLSEGFATYFTLLFREHAYGRDDFVTGLRQAADAIWPLYEEMPAYTVVHDDLQDMADVTTRIIYQKGAWVLHMLRKQVGDEAFWDGIRAYYAAHMNGTASTADFRRAMEEASGQDLRPFFDQWLRQGGNPRLRGGWSYDPASGEVHVELAQVEDVGSFSFPLEIGVYLPGDVRPTVLETVRIAGPSQRFTIPVPAEPAEVRLDPDTWALFRADFARRARPGAPGQGPRAGSANGAAAGPLPDTVDVLFRGGTVYDGSGAEGRIADVGITGERVSFLGDAASADVHARRTVDARGLVVAPGFIDPHAHAQGDLAHEERGRRENLNYLMQGVTTVVVGNDGHGTWDVAGQRAAFADPGIGTNAAMLVGFGAVRGEVMGMQDRAPTAGELERMEALVDGAMRAGALGMSTGLFYAPQSYASTGEVVELARVVGRHGGIYDSHLRDESSYGIGLVAAVREAIDIGAAADVPVNISHLKALGVDVWGRSDDVIALVRDARARGQRVTADQYPYEASGSSLHASLLPRWAQAGGRDSLAARLADPDTRARIAAEMRDNMRRRNGPEAFLVTGGEDRSLRGRTLAEIAAERGQDPLEVALDIIEDGGAGIGSFNMNEDDIVAFMQAEFVMTGSDGSGGHPRKYGTYPRKIRRYVLDDPVLTMARMIEASAAQPARVLGLEGRGVLEPGAWADVAVFDPATIRDEATFLEPTRLATGMRYVLVNGAFAVDGGEPTHALAGRVLERAPPPIS